MSTYVWKDGRFVDKTTGEPMAIPARAGFCTPALQVFQVYRSPVGDHREIGSRQAQRDDLKRHDCVLVPPRDKPRELKNPRFAKKWGLEHRLAPEVRETLTAAPQA
jgi:hypothetical protein